eukprot:jgi/Mesvir1/25166/Mv18846-RA.1
MKVTILPDGTKVLTSDKCTARVGSVGVRTRRFRLDPAAFHFIINSMSRGAELGGNFSVDLRSSVMRKATVTNVGRSNDVNTPHGVVEWHTHPQGCTLRECSLSSPSDTDVGVFLEDALTDNVAHCVFSRQGTFVCACSPALVARLQRLKGEGGDSALAAAKGQIQRQFADLQRQFAVRYRQARSEREKDHWEAWHRGSGCVWRPRAVCSFRSSRAACPP